MNISWGERWQGLAAEKRNGNKILTHRRNVSMWYIFVEKGEGNQSEVKAKVWLRLHVFQSLRFMFFFGQWIRVVREVFFMSVLSN